MRIAQIAPPWLTIPPEDYGGTESVVSQLVEQQVACGHEVTLFAPGDAKTSAQHVSFFPSSLIREGVPWSMHCKAFYHLQKSLEYIQQHDFDIVHSHLSSSSDLYLFPLTAHLTIPHVTTLHSCFPFDRTADDWFGDADHYYMDWAPQVPIVAISETARSLVEYPLHFVGVVHNGIDMKQFPQSAHKCEEHLVWLGRFVLEKGAHLAIAAAKEAHVPLVLAGTVDEQVSAAVAYFHEKIEPELDKNDITYIGPVGYEQRADLLSHALGFLNPIEWEEPFGMVMIEAMAAGCPVISFNRGAAREIILPDVTGYLVQNLTEMIQMIPHLAKLNRQATQDYVKNTFTNVHMAQKYMQIYQQVIAQTSIAATGSHYAKKYIADEPLPLS